MIGADDDTMTTKPRSHDRHARIGKLFPWRHPMQAIEIDTKIDDNGEIHIKLPEPRRPGPARVIVLFDTDQEGRTEPVTHRPPPSLAGRSARLHCDDIAPELAPATEQPNDFAGIWADLSDEDFRALLSDIDDRRRAAFKGRPAQGLSIDDWSDPPTAGEAP